MKYKRIFLMILDSLGVGEAVDASNYGDTGANTLSHINEKCPLFVPNLQKLGFLDTLTLREHKDVEGYYTFARPTNTGKDSLSGHYELMGIKNNIPFKTFAETGFPRELIDEIERVTGRKIIGNKVSDAATIVSELGERQMEQGSLILFMTNESNLQIAAHEDVVPMQKLYTYCEKIRRLTMKEEWRVGRVIARPFTGKPGKFRLTNERKDYAIKPPRKTVLDFLKEHNYNVISIGKINDIFDGEGITKVIKATSNMEAINKLTDIMEKDFKGLCVINLDEFDQQGHARNTESYANLIEQLDVEIPMIINKLNNDDLLIITADHGNDPTFKGNSHTRENVPVMIFGRSFREPKCMEPLDSLSDIGATIADNFEVEEPEIGISILDELK